MAKRRKRVLPARKRMVVHEDDSLLIRSAESLGRIIGSLQRQVMDRSEERTTAQKPRKASASRKRRTTRKTSKKR